MPQGKFKKAKLPDNILKKQKAKNNSAFTRRAHAPIQPKKSKMNESQKIKQAISKSLNRTVEDEIRGRASEGKLNLSKAQQAVAKHHKDKEITTTTRTDENL